MDTIPSIKRRVPLNGVLLIDEYNFPLFSDTNNSKRIDRLRKIFYEFFCTIKSCKNMLRYTFITGIFRYTELSKFCGLNNIVDISHNPDYSSICGFTEDEIKSNFPICFWLSLI
jgi:hypothetical protein